MVSVCSRGMTVRPFVSWIRDATSKRRYDLHLLLDVDVPWVADPQRDRPHLREEMLARLHHALETDGRRYELVAGSWDARLEQALGAIARLS